MRSDWTSRLRHPAAQLLLGGIGLALLTVASFRLGLNTTVTGFAYAIPVVLLALMGNPVGSLVLAVLAAAGLQYLFAAPLFDLRVDRPEDARAVVIFLAASILINAFVTRRILPIATAVFATAILIVDILTDLQIAFAVFYVVVVLMAARFCNARGILFVGMGCICVTALSFFLSPPSGPQSAGIANTLISSMAIALTTLLALQSQSAETALREQASLLDLTHDTIFSRGMDDAITYWNCGAEELYGWNREEALGKVSYRLLETHFPAPPDEINAQLLRTGRWEGELIHKRRDGSRLVVASRWSLQRDDQGRPAAILETNTDITERKRAQESLEEAQANLARANRVMLLGEMTASIAHEVNQPISAAITNANACSRWLALQPPDLEEARQALARIVRDGNRASEVIGRVRTLVKKMPPQRERMAVNEAILEVIALTESELQKKRIVLQTRLASGLPLVSADHVQLQQVTLNLILNAIEAMSGVGERKRELTVRSAASEANVLVEVADSGSGLDPATLDRLFDSFYTTKPDGMGMGLAISRSIVEAHGGFLWAASNEPHGAVFRFTLPIEEESSAQPAPPT